MSQILIELNKALLLYFWRTSHELMVPEFKRRIFNEFNKGH